MAHFPNEKYTIFSASFVIDEMTWEIRVRSIGFAVTHLFFFAIIWTFIVRTHQRATVER